MSAGTGTLATETLAGQAVAADAYDPMLDGVVPYPRDVADRYLAAGYWGDRTLDRLVRDTAARRPHHPAVIDRDRTATYAELVKRFDAAAAALRARGVAPGDRVLIHLPNVLEFFDAVYGTISLGALPVFAVHTHRHAEMEHLAQASGAVLLLTSRQIPGLDADAFAAELAARLPGLPLAYAEDLCAEHPDGAVRAAETPAPCPRPAHAAAFLQLSGGTTGRPKLIPRTHRDYAYSVERSAEVCGLDDSTVFLAGIPLAHNFAASSPGYMGVLATGGTVVAALNGSPDLVFGLVERHRVTLAAAVPPLALSWLNSPARSRYDLSAWKVLQVGGAKLARATAERIEPELGPRLQQVFGMAEGLVCYTGLDDDADTVLGTQGRPMSDADEVLVLDDDGRPVPDGSPGNLWVRGPYTIRGYYGNPPANAASFTEDGFYGSGDIVIRHPNGCLSVVGRTKDIINRGGEKVSPDEVEGALLRHPGVHDASLVGEPDEALGERTHAYVVPRAGAEPPKAKALRAWLRTSGLADHKVPDLVTVVDRLPTTHVGKISRTTLRPAPRLPQGES
ncbi:(2,3-dihydroxybenzoyl)adenylate synthase [Arthrobacter ginkgonis]|uniref:(2,3-dihydroxybenzoyl)adenylate synthase n=1 Tax=Arthrobacter ginkgonis TaxID=1630594 RepID=A0ABP7CIG4_9MICC